MLRVYLQERKNGRPADFCSWRCVEMVWVEVFRYLGRLLEWDDNNTQAIHSQLWKAGALELV
jgi:hypothetical protein